MEPIEPRKTEAAAPTEPPPPSVTAEVARLKAEADARAMERQKTLLANQERQRLTDLAADAEKSLAEQRKLAEPQAVSLMDRIGAEGQKAPDPVPAKPPISGLVVGRVVHVLDKGQLKAAIVAQVHDDAEGDITVRVQEPSGPTRAWRLPWSGAYQSLAEGCWQWMFDGQAGRYRPSV